MDLQRLRYFVAAAERNIRRAASTIGVRPSVVSRSITALEAELGVSLFERLSTGVRLTEVGRVFLTDAQRILADVDRAQETAQRVAVGRAGRLRLGLCEDATTPTFAEIIAMHRECCPDVVLDLFEMPTVAQAIALRRGELDVGLVLPPVPSDGLQIDELWQEDWLVALPAAHPLAASAVIDEIGAAIDEYLADKPTGAEPEGIYDRLRRDFGHPAVAAARFVDRKPLVGAAMTHAYWRVLAIVCPAVLLIQLAVALTGAADVAHMIDHAGRVLLRLFGHLFMAIGIVTMVFVFLDGGWRTVCRIFGLSR
jgi:DNA-binding transcriptional LysR family regulator